jgi:hypothetical protein
MTADTKVREEKAEDDVSKVTTLEIMATFFAILGLVTAIVFMLLPFRSPVGGAFQGRPQPALWLLFTFSLVFETVLLVLGVPKVRSRRYSTIWGIANLALGYLCAVEIFVLNFRGVTTGRSLWWLFPVLTVLGIVSLYLPKRAKRLEEEEEKRKQEEELAKECRSRPRLIRFKVHRYYVSENKRLVCKD